MISIRSLSSLRQRSLRVILGAFFAAALAAGCGGGSDSTTDVLSEAAGSTATARITTERAQALAVTWTQCATEGATCSFSGTREVRFGTSTQYTSKTFTGSVACSSSVFGDPAYGSRKYCWYASDTTTASSTSGTTSATTSTSGTTGWTWCSGEGGTCKFSGTQTVRYGTTSSNVTKTLSNGTVCNNSVFGDPAPGQAKSCWTGGTTSTGTTTTPTTTTNTSTSYGTTQVFPLRDQYVWGEQGQYTNIRLRVYGVPLGSNTKIFVHLYNSGGGLVAATGHHLRYLPSAGWSGYTQYEHPVYVPTNVAPGTYRVVVGFYYYLSPYTMMMNRFVGNGVSLISTSTNNAGYHVGYMTVGAATRAAVADQTSGAFVPVNGTAWY